MPLRRILLGVAHKMAQRMLMLHVCIVAYCDYGKECIIYYATIYFVKIQITSLVWDLGFPTVASFGC